MVVEFDSAGAGVTRVDLQPVRELHVGKFQAMSFDQRAATRAVRRWKVCCHGLGA